jgi:hypothetical protein
LSPRDLLSADVDLKLYLPNVKAQQRFNHPHFFSNSPVNALGDYPHHILGNTPVKITLQHQVSCPQDVPMLCVAL